MMIPSQIKNYEFKAAGRNAYKADDVDSFFGEVLVNYEKLYRENIEFSKRLSLLADRLEKYKNDEVDIKQAVLSAQKAADIIKKDAEESAVQIRQEAESILAAAKGEANIIKADAEKQAIADSDLLLAMARDKAEDIIKKAKEKAHGILIAANNSASDTVGAANRTITSESIHYDMLKKEVSEFRASILAQYKAHIELISKLPELAVEEAGKITIETPEVEVSVDDLEDFDADDNAPQGDSILEFDETPEDINADFNDEPDVILEADEETVSEEAESDEAVENELEDTSSDIADNDDFEPHYTDIPISKKFSVNTDDLVFEGFESDASDDNNDIETEDAEESCDTDTDEDNVDVDVDDDTSVEDNENADDSIDENTNDDQIVYEDIYSNDVTSDSDNDDDSNSVADDVIEETAENRRSRYARMFGEDADENDAANGDNNNSFSSFFDSIETIDSDDEGDDSDESTPKVKFSFFRRKK